MFTHITRDVLSEKELLKLNRFTYVFVGTTALGFVFWIVLMLFSNVTGIRWSAGKIFGGDGIFALITLIFCYIVGAYVGDWIGKKRKYYVRRLP